MTQGEIWKDFFKKTVLTVLIAGVLFYWATLVFTKDGATNYFYVWLCCGIPFGIRRMFVWLIPRGFDLSGTVGVVALNFIVGGLIGGVILIWRLAVAAWYIPLTHSTAAARLSPKNPRRTFRRCPWYWQSACLPASKYPFRRVDRRKDCISCSF